jgi:hypothetical protein
MTVALTGFAFEDCMENGGIGVKVGFYRVQGARIAKKRVRQSRRTDDGRLVYDGPMIQENDDVYMVDCNVTGSDSGTSDSPKFDLVSLFSDTVFPRVAELVAAGGRFEGYTPVFQGDNAGPHQDRTFFNYCREHCGEQGWHWEPQAPQMPHMNNLDLAVFPAMSKRHSAILKGRGNSVAPPDEIWNAAEAVWKDLPSSTIARGYVLAYQIAEKVIKGTGSNRFLCDSSLHSSIRKDFYNTDSGIKPTINVIS